MKRPTFRRQWLVVWLLVLAVMGWLGGGQAWIRRHLLHPSPISAEARVDSRFLALLFPSITPGSRPFAMSRKELTDLLGQLKKKGYVTIGLEDVREFYAGRRLLPPKAVLLAFRADDPRSVLLADRALKGLRMRGNAFLPPSPKAGDAVYRRVLTRHAIGEMSSGGAWQFGRLATGEAADESAPELLNAVLVDAAHPLAVPPASGLRFVASELGLNDAADDARGLNIMIMRPDRSREVSVGIIENSWTRRAGITDDFTTKELDPDWIAGWGVVSKGDGRLALLPLPRQTGAGIFLRGTEKWRDLVLKFDLYRHQKEFWAYARYQGEAGYVRFGIRGGWWYVEQKIGRRNLPTMLGRAVFVDDGKPARVRFVLKGENAIVHVNGRMLFGHALQVHPRVASGRVLLGVYDAKPRSAMAVLSHLVAGPVQETWVAFKDEEGRDDFDEQRLYALREAAVYARALSPHWLTVSAGGGVRVHRGQETLIRSLAGFFGCQLIPMAEFQGGSDTALSDPAVISRLVEGLDTAARDLDASGVNIRMRSEALERPDTLRFLARLRARLRGERRQVWVTVDGPMPTGTHAALPIDGLLRPSVATHKGYESLDAVAPPTINASPKEYATLP